MDFKIKVDDYDIINTGTVIILSNGIMNLNLKDSDLDLDMNFRFRFSTASNGEDSNFITTVNEDENYLEINIINSSKANNMGHKGLLKIADIGDRQLFLKFLFTQTETDEVIDTLFNYTLYLKN